MRLFGLASSLADTRHPLLQLVLVVEIAEALDRLDVLRFPRLGSSPVEADDREVRRRGGDDRRDALLEALRAIDHHQRDLAVTKELERSLDVLLVEPCRVPELDRRRHADAPQAIDRVLDRVAVLR